MTPRKAAVLSSALLLSLGAAGVATPATVDTPKRSSVLSVTSVVDAIERSAHTLRSTGP
ncbi:hypothetical protein [Streptomyces sp. NPDC059781]|uniref:hypothetical protein n=1 Tax=Streptomyces sp. NPDC059781 TaxID=3346943 RepID=UPI00364CDDA8